MEAIREIQVVKEGQIRVHLPEQFWGRRVEVIIIPDPQHKSASLQKRSLRGCLHDYANPALITHENKAWQNAVSEKYGDH